MYFHLLFRSCVQLLLLLRDALSFSKLESFALETGGLGDVLNGSVSSPSALVVEFERWHTCLIFLGLEFPRALVQMYRLASPVASNAGMSSCLEFGQSLAARVATCGHVHLHFYSFPSALTTRWNP